MIEGDVLTGRVSERYAGWDAPDHAARGGTLEEVAAAAERRALSPQPRSGRQERLESIVARA